MAITFNTRASVGNVVMLDATARRILEIVGKEFGPRGVITAAEAPLAVKRLRDAIAVSRREPDSAPTSGDDDATAAAGRDSVPLATRAFPFIEMLERAHAAGKDILWGV